jgi:hypothetical protein
MQDPIDPDVDDVLTNKISVCETVPNTLESSKQQLAKMCTQLGSTCRYATQLHLWKVTHDVIS